jgi:hypothetical protein
MSSERYYSNIEAVKELNKDVDVNEHLKSGWELLAIKERSKTTADPMTALPVQEVELVYIVGLLKGVPQPLQSPVVAKPLTLGDVKGWFPDDIQGLLSFEETTENFKVKPTSFLGASTFAKIAEIVKQNNGVYVSAGRESHFKIPKVK